MPIPLGREALAWHAHLASLAVHTYRPLDQIQLDTDPELRGYLRVHDLSHRDVDAYVWTSEREMVIVFRGTQPRRWRDLVRNVRVHQVEARDATGRRIGRVHAGFWGGVEALWPDLIAAVNRIQDRRLIVCGHSQGGAIAVRAVQRLRPIITPEAVVTWGEPRSGDQEAAEAWPLHVPYYPYAHYGDVVPLVPDRRLPPWEPYVHVQARRWLRGPGWLPLRLHWLERYRDGLADRAVA